MVCKKNSYLLVYKLFEFAVEFNTCNRNKEEIIFSSKNYFAIAD